MFDRLEAKYADGSASRVKVRFTESAEDDLERIGDEIAETDTDRARLTVKGLRAAARSIGALPRAWSPVLTSPAVRKKSVPPYALLYTILDEEIVLLRMRTNGAT